jgi:hypothetical protein
MKNRGSPAIDSSDPAAAARGASGRRGLPDLGFIARPAAALIIGGTSGERSFDGNVGEIDSSGRHITLGKCGNARGPPGLRPALTGCRRDTSEQDRVS